MKRMHASTSQSDLSHHLHVVSMHYAANATELRGLMARGDISKGHERMAEQFERQAKECVALSDAFAQAEGMSADGDTLNLSWTEVGEWSEA